MVPLESKHWVGDAWVPRPDNQDRVLNTGEHPFNCETRITTLAQDVYTPTEHHYVRNHGDVPQLTWESHHLSIIGLDDEVKQP